MDQVDQVVPEITNPLDKRIWSWQFALWISLLSLFVFGLLYFLLIWVSQSAPQLKLDLANPTPLLSAILAGIEALGLIIGVLVFGLGVRKLSLLDLGLNRPASSWLATAGCLALAAIPAIGLLATGIRYLIGKELANPQMSFLAPGSFSWGGAAAMLVMGGIAVPVAEELYFRGVLYRWLRGVSRPWVAGLISSALFGALHGEISIAIATSVMGLVLAWFYERSRSLWPPIIIHIVNNSVSILAVYLLAASGIDISGL